MRLILDTHIVLWIVSNSKSLTRDIRRQIESADELYFSTASHWECAIKQATGKLQVDLDALEDAIADLSIRNLDITAAHIRQLRRLPPLHKDPFDRIIFAQARSEGMRLISVDAIFNEYARHLYDS
jgi:PIN domain nuclease of toxin-antitoxin system